MSTPAYQLPSVRYGDRYEETKGETTSQIAKRVRADIRADVRAGVIPAETYSVRCTGYNSLTIEVRTWSGPVWDKASDWEPGDYRRRPYHPALQATLDHVTALAWAYNFDGSDISVDYHHVRFYGGRADIAWEIQSGRTTDARPAKRDASPVSKAAADVRAALAERWPGVAFTVRAIPRRGAWNPARVKVTWTDGPAWLLVRELALDVSGKDGLAVEAERAWSPTVYAAHDIAKALGVLEWFCSLSNAAELGPWLDCGEVLAGLATNGPDRLETLEGMGADALAAISGTSVAELMAWTLEDAFALADFPAA